MRRVLLGCALALVAAAPAGAAAPPTKTPSTLLVGLHMPSSGFQVGSVKGTQVVVARGFEVDLAKALAERLAIQNVTFYQEPSFDGIVGPGPKAWDLALAQVTVTPARQKLVDFSAPYLNDDEGVLLRRGLKVPARSLADLRGLKLCAQPGSTGAITIAKKIQPAAKPLLYNSQGELMQNLQRGRCDAVVDDAPTLAALKALSPARYGEFAGVVPTGARYGIVFPQGSPLAGPVNKALAELSKDGTVSALAQKWLTVDPAQLPVLPSSLEPPTMTLIGDSVSAALDYVPKAQKLLGRGLKLRLHADVCRRLVAASCTYQGHTPPTALQTIDADGHALGQVVVIDVGYNDDSSTYKPELDLVMKHLVASGVQTVIWVTLRETRGYYATINGIVRAATKRWPQIVVADWNSYSAGQPWFASGDGLHLNDAGAIGLAKLLRPLVLSALGFTA
jgi:polar amino acid transport system substrate-binding protein